MDKDLKEVGEGAVQVSGGRAFQAAGAAGAKVLESLCMEHGAGAAGME